MCCPYQTRPGPLGMHTHACSTCMHPARTLVCMFAPSLLPSLRPWPGSCLSSLLSACATPASYKASNLSCVLAVPSSGGVNPTFAKLYQHSSHAVQLCPQMLSLMGFVARTQTAGVGRTSAAVRMVSRSLTSAHKFLSVLASLPACVPLASVRCCSQQSATCMTAPKCKMPQECTVCNTLCIQ